MGNSADYGVKMSMIFSSLAGVFVLARICTRFFVVKHVGVEDYLMTTAVMFSFLFSSMMELQRQHGLGQHIYTLEPQEIVQMMKAFFASIYLYNFGLLCAKSSILVQFLRFFQGRSYRFVAWFMLVFGVSYSVAAAIGTSLACTPTAYFWDRSIQGGHCFNLAAFWLTNSIVTIVTDIALCLLPMPLLWTLNLPHWQKFTLLLVFILGGFGCVTAGLRLKSIELIGKSNDPTHDNVGAAMWSSIELNTAIMCGSLATLRPLIDRIAPKILPLSSSRVPQLNDANLSQYSQARQPSKDTGTITSTVLDRDEEMPLRRLVTEGEDVYRHYSRATVRTASTASVLVSPQEGV